MLDIDLIAPVPALLAQHARERSETIAFADCDSAVTYRELDARTTRLAGHLIAAGITDGERLVMYLDNCVEAVEGYLVAPRARIVTACADPNVSTAELSYILGDSGARAVLTDRSRLESVLSVLDTEPYLVSLVVVVGSPDRHLQSDDRVIWYDDLLSTTPKAEADDGAGLDDWCWMLYTSGTTGRPKGVQLTQRGCLWVVGACWKPIVGLGPGDVLLSALPLFHSYTLVLSVVGVVATGATAHLMARFSPSRVLDFLRNHAVTVLPEVPTMFRYLLDTSGADRLEAPQLRLCVSAGSVMSASLNREFEMFSQVPLLDGYGITETSTMVTMNSPIGSRPPGSCGLPLPGLSVRLVDPSTGTDTAPSEEGEIWVQGPNVALGYYNLPDATAAAFVDGWYRTGDLARRDRHGFLTISGRIKELIIRGGENIYPAEIENVLNTAASVADAAVVAEPHPALGEVPVAFVVPADGRRVDAENLRRHCLEKLAKYKVPVDFVEVADIPRTGSGKVRRHLLVRSTTEATEKR
ncbi:class I adenylate-forming enzyme family protein [Nocardia sp. NPDC004654]|uniref:class I adenylate-forming enzyme family protein n=1 Tax=Nocardia sp. NPDC004654 TaxID=3154776 RepID=UPI0033B0B802